MRKLTVREVLFPTVFIFGTSTWNVLVLPATQVLLVYDTG